MRTLPDRFEGLTGEVRTRRLLLRPFTREDSDELHILYGDPRVMSIRRIGVQDLAGTVHELAGLVEHWTQHGFGMWHTSCASEGRFLGECGLRFREGSDNTEIEVSYGLVPEKWGSGLATEGAQAAVRLGFETMQLPRLVAISRADNLASHTVLQKCGFSLIERDDSRAHPIVRFEMLASVYSGTRDNPDVYSGKTDKRGVTNKIKR